MTTAEYLKQLKVYHLFLNCVADQARTRGVDVLAKVRVARATLNSLEHPEAISNLLHWAAIKIPINWDWGDPDTFWRRIHDAYLNKYLNK